MSEDKLRQVFSKNLKKQLALHDKQPVDLVNDLHIPFSTVSNWVNGAKFPRMGKIELLAQYFGIEKSDLIEEKQDQDYVLTLPPDEMQILIEYRDMSNRQKDFFKEIIKFIKRYQEINEREDSNE